MLGLIIIYLIMKKSETWTSIISYWSRYGLPIRQGVTSESIKAFEEKYQVNLPFDFAEYLQVVDGTGIDDSDENILVSCRLLKCGLFTMCWMTVEVSCTPTGLHIPNALYLQTI